MMADFPFTWPYSFFQAPKALDQSINPGWFDVNINNYAGNPQLEKDIVEKVASFGKQLGILTEAVLELAGSKPRSEDSAITSLREIAAKIEALIQSVAQLSNASFVRNGTAYDARTAADHLRTKLDNAGSRGRLLNCLFSVGLPAIGRSVLRRTAERSQDQCRE